MEIANLRYQGMRSGSFNTPLLHQRKPGLKGVDKAHLVWGLGFAGWVRECDLEMLTQESEEARIDREQMMNEMVWASVEGGKPNA